MLRLFDKIKLIFILNHQIDLYLLSQIIIEQRRSSNNKDYGITKKNHEYN